MTRRHDPTTAAGIAAWLRNLATALTDAFPEEAADLLEDIFTEGGILDEVNAVLTVARDLITDEVPLSKWDDTHPGYVLCHRLADTTEFLRDQTQELRDAPQILRQLPAPAFSTAADRTRPAPSAPPLPPSAAPPVPAPTSPRTTR